MKAAQQIDQEFSDENFGIGNNVGDLTVSFFPGTTLRSKEVEDIKIGTRVIHQIDLRFSIPQGYLPITG
jgi:hypothetical protein